jgi:hypothetical protein
MSDNDEWGPWIDHDGACLRGVLPANCHLQVQHLGSGIRAREGEVVNFNWPGFFWRWRTVRTGLFSSELSRVCDDPQFCPIVRYRIRKPRGLTILEGLLENLPSEVDA